MQLEEYELFMSRKREVQRLKDQLVDCLTLTGYQIACLIMMGLIIADEINWLFPYFLVAAVLLAVVESVSTFFQVLHYREKYIEWRGM
jgi:hypothetical protein